MVAIAYLSSVEALSADGLEEVVSPPASLSHSPGSLVGLGVAVLEGKQTPGEDSGGEGNGDSHLDIAGWASIQPSSGHNAISGATLVQERVLNSRTQYHSGLKNFQQPDK